jgi:hypothetical protein
MRHVRAEAREQALKRLILIAEEHEFGAGAMGVDKGLVKGGVFKAGIVEDQQVLREAGRCESHGHRRADSKVTDHGEWFPDGGAFFCLAEKYVPPNNAASELMQIVQAAPSFCAIASRTAARSARTERASVTV